MKLSIWGILIIALIIFILIRGFNWGTALS